MLASYNLISSFTSYDFYASAGTFTLGGKEYSVVAVVGGVILAILVAICVLEMCIRDRARSRAAAHQLVTTQGTRFRRPSFRGTPSASCRRIRFQRFIIFV